MEQPQRKTTARVRSQEVFNDPVVDISTEDITDTMRVETKAKDVLTALDEVKNMWQSGQVDYVSAAVVLDIHKSQGYSIYTPEKGVMTPDESVEERIDYIKEMDKMDGHMELEGLYIDTVRLPEDSYELHIAKVVVVHQPYS